MLGFVFSRLLLSLLALTIVPARPLLALSLLVTLRPLPHLRPPVLAPFLHLTLVSLPVTLPHVGPVLSRPATPEIAWLLRGITAVTIERPIVLALGPPAFRA